MTPAPEAKTVPMDEAFIAMYADCRAAVQAVDTQLRGALTLFLRQHGMEGEWRIAANGRELERV